jgi:RNA:NAD 2'-phosphotransferase (TPT1/KptA family)
VTGGTSDSSTSTLLSLILRHQPSMVGITLDAGQGLGPVSLG